MFLMKPYRCKLIFDSVREVVGIAIEPGSAELTSVEYLLIDFGKAPLAAEYAKQIRDQLIADNTWKTKEAKYFLIPQNPF